MSDVVKSFPELLREYMWKRREPPINPNRLAQELGVARQTVLNWLDGTKPMPDMLPHIAEKIDVPLPVLYKALGYPVLEVVKSNDEVLRELQETIEHDEHYTAEDRTRFIQTIRAVRTRYGSDDCSGPAPLAK